MTEQPDWTEQARRLVAGLSGVLGGAFGGGAAPSATGAEPGSGAAVSDCRWCPLCQTAAMLRGERPELSAAMADVLATAAEALRSVAAQGADGPPAGQPSAEQAAPEDAADPDLIDLDEPPAPGHEGAAVQRIEIG
jgi:hypothetical protein